MSTSIAEGWYYRYNLNFNAQYCDDNSFFDVTAYKLGHCYYDSLNSVYVNITCSSTTAYISQYITSDCTGSQTTAFQPLACEAVFHAYFGCTSDKDWTKLVPTNGVYGLQQFFANEDNCNTMTKTDEVNSTVLYFQGQINNTCIPTYTDTSTKFVFPTDYTYGTTNDCTSTSTSTTWPTTCTAGVAGQYSKAFTVGSVVPSFSPTLAPTSDDDSSEGLATMYWIIIAVVVFAALLSAGAAYWYYYGKKAKKSGLLLEESQA